MSIGVRRSDLYSYPRQTAPRYPAYITAEIMEAAFRFLERNGPLKKSALIRALYVCVGGLINDDVLYQSHLFGAQEKSRRLGHLNFYH